MDNRNYWVVNINASTIGKQNFSLSYYALLLCDCGTMTIEVNMVKMVVTEGCRLCLPNVILSRVIEVSDDFHALGIIIDSDFIVEMSAGVPSELIQSSFLNPVRRINDEKDWNLIISIMNAIEIQSENITENNFLHGIMSNLFRALLYTLGAIESKFNEKDIMTYHFTIHDSFFLRFINLINTNIQREHEVNFYAHQLSITPKYLNDMIKRKTGRKAKELLSQLLVARLKYEMLSSGKALKIIADEYNFADQSSLGKFFRKMTGISPAVFRNKRNG